MSQPSQAQAQALAAALATADREADKENYYEAADIQVTYCLQLFIFRASVGRLYGEGSSPEGALRDLVRRTNCSNGQ